MLKKDKVEVSSLSSQNLIQLHVSQQFQKGETQNLPLILNRRELHLMKECNKVESKNRSDLGNKRQCIVLYCITGSLV